MKEYVIPNVKVDDIIFSGDEEIVVGRGVLFKKLESDTIYWIDNFIKPNEILYDIGANIGVFSLYSAKKGVQIFAFEAESGNYFYLNKNIYLNNLSDKIQSFNIAINDKSEFSMLNLSNFKVGKSLHNFKEKLDLNHKEFKPIFQQGCFGISLDEIVYKYNLPKPHHLKIDVDGNEYKIINGAKKLLEDQYLKSIAIELNDTLSIDREIENILINKGFKLIENKKLKNEYCKQNGNVYNKYFIREKI